MRRAVVVLGLAFTGCSDTVVSTCGAPQIDVSPSPLDFRDVAAEGRRLDVTVRNSGCMRLVTSGYRVTGPGFSAPGAAPLTLEAGVAGTVTVEFRPLTLGPAEGVLTIQSNALGTDAEKKVTLLGRGVLGAPADAGPEDALPSEASTDATTGADADDQRDATTDAEVRRDATADAGPDADAAPRDATSDAGPGACASGERRRCWVECTQSYSAGCIHADLPPRIMGVETCAGGAWGACATQSSCIPLAGACTNGTTLPVQYECLAGGVRTGAMTCTRPLGAMCTSSYPAGWGITECVTDQSQLCLGAGDTCANEGESRPCEVHCDAPNGRVRAGTQQCIGADCGGGLGHVRLWGPCLTNDGCLQP